MSKTGVWLAYGQAGMTVQLPEHATVVQPKVEHPSASAEELLRRAFADPTGTPRLRELVGPGQRVAVSVCDVTRPQPRRELLEALLTEVEGIVRPEDITILIATGSHRGSSDRELQEMLGAATVSSTRVVNHDARDPQQLVHLGVMGAGVPVWLNREWLEADVRVTMGVVEPHFFAGFGGGPKMVAPGLAGLETILTLHDARRIGHPNATWGICEGNPVHDDVRAIASGTGVDFSIDVVLNAGQEVTHAFCGSLLSVHREARGAALDVCMQPVDDLFDVVVTTNAGYPLDQNLYQCVKGMTAGMGIVRPGGLIICAAECRDGLPDHGRYAELLHSRSSPGELLQMIEAGDRTVPDQWQVQMQARVQARARVMVATSGLADDELRAAHLEPCDDISAAVQEELGRTAGPGRVCVLPYGPQTVPFLNER